MLTVQIAQTAGPDVFVSFGYSPIVHGFVVTVQPFPLYNVFQPQQESLLKMENQ